MSRLLRRVLLPRPSPSFVWPAGPPTSPARLCFRVLLQSLASPAFGFTVPSSPLALVGGYSPARASSALDLWFHPLQRFDL
ncbi:hypothetical protein SLA2020_273830 [Shorea laevis]